MLTTEQQQKITYQMDRVRHADKTVCPFMTTSQEFWYTNGYLSGLFNFGVISPGEYVRLIDLAGNAFEYRSKEVQSE